MRIVFLGSAALAVPSLEAILDAGKDEIAAVVSAPDRPAGRGRKLTPCPLKQFAVERGLTVFTPEKIAAPEAVESIARFRPDLLVVVAYGQYIPERVVNLAPFRAINLHPSLLPRYRGAAPIQRAIENGETTTGVSIIDLAPEMDAGDILRQASFPIAPDDTSATLHDKLARFGAHLLLETLDDFRAGSVTRRPQNPDEVSYAPKLTKEEGRIDWTLPAERLHNRIRAFEPWPGTFCLLPDGRPLKIRRARIEEGAGRPGEALDDRLLVATGQGALRLIEVQPPGKPRMSAADFLNGHPIEKGSLLG